MALLTSMGNFTPLKTLVRSSLTIAYEIALYSSFQHYWKHLFLTWDDGSKFQLLSSTDLYEI